MRARIASAPRRYLHIEELLDRQAVAVLHRHVVHVVDASVIGMTAGYMRFSEIFSLLRCR
jgi:hypothetical protein